MKNAVKILSISLISILILTACEFGFDKRPEEVAVEIIPVENITGIPTGSLPFIALTLSGIIMPENATNKKIEWSIASNGANAALAGNKLTANSEGNVTVTAVIKDGLAADRDYTQSFSIQFSLISPIPVIGIKGIPSSITRGSYTLNGNIIPTNALNKTMLWSVKNAGTTGASIYGNILTTTSPGTVVVTATIENGLLEQGDYKQDFSIIITKNVYLAGHYGSPYKACYWIDDKLYDMEVPAGTTESRTSGIVFANGKQYISGYYNNGTTTACYWVDGVRHDLDGTETFSIAADGADVYITGKDSSATYCYWKIENGTAEKKTLSLPSSPSVGATLKYEGRFAVSGGKLYIPFYYQDGGTAVTGSWNTVTLTSYYWDESGPTSKPITLDSGATKQYAVKCAAIVNGNVYMAGFTRQGAALFPFYFVNGTPTHNTGIITSNRYYEYDYNASFIGSIYDSNGNIIDTNRGNTIIFDDGVGSIVAQNGVPWFYCNRTSSGPGNEFRYDTAVNKGYLPGTDYMFDIGKVVFSEGDVYIILRERVPANNYIGYAVLDGSTISEKQTRILIDPDGNVLPKVGQISGIAVP